MKRIVVKAGSNCLTTDSVIDDAKIAKLASDIAACVKSGHQVVLVTSGAIASGAGRLGWTAKSRSMAEKQAASSVGQVVLMEAYMKHFAGHGLIAGQVLLTEEDFTDRERYLNAKSTLEVLLKHRVVPVVNENDTVSTAEIVFGDNDMLSALIAACVSADLLVVLTSVDGLLDASKNVVPVVADIDAVTGFVEKTKTRVGTGGMETKLKAMRTVTESGKPGVIAHSAGKDVLARILKGEDVGTIFLPAGSVSGKKQWLKYGTEIKGRVTIDEGAEKALRSGKSLLASGVVKIEGGFAEKSVIEILNSSDKPVARGIVTCSSEDLARIKGMKSSEFEKVLGRKVCKEAVHRDNLVLI